MTGKYTWAIGPTIQVPPGDQWTPILFPRVVVNTDDVALLEDGCTWEYATTGLWSLMVNVAWARGKWPMTADLRIIGGHPGGLMLPVASTSLNVPWPGQGDVRPFLQQVCMQPGALVAGMHMVVEVRHDAVLPQSLVADGIQAPSFMQAKISEISQ